MYEFVWMCINDFNFDASNKMLYFTLLFSVKISKFVAIRLQETGHLKNPAKEILSHGENNLRNLQSVKIHATYAMFSFRLKNENPKTNIVS